MGLKSGSRDAGLSETDEEEADDRPDEHGIDESPAESITRSPEQHSSTSDSEPTGPSESKSGTDQRPAMDSIPYKLRRDKVNEGREQVPYFLREEVIDSEDALQETLEEMLGEDVYKSDYREAAMVVAQRNPELVAEVLREWGYDLDAV